MLNHDNESTIKWFNHNHRNISKIPSQNEIMLNDDMQIPLKSAETLQEILVSYLDAIHRCLWSH